MAADDRPAGSYLATVLADYRAALVKGGVPDASEIVKDAAHALHHDLMPADIWDHMRKGPEPPSLEDISRALAAHVD